MFCTIKGGYIGTLGERSGQRLAIHPMLPLCPHRAYDELQNSFTDPLSP